MNLTIQRDAGTLVATLDGRIEGLNSVDLQKTLEEEIETTDKALILNMENLSYISSAGLRAIAMMFNRTRSIGIGFAICSMSNSVSKVVTTSGFHRLLPVFGTLEEARSAVSTRNQ